MILVAGEALIDLVADGDVLRPTFGGGPFNTAIALARLGTPVAFFGRLSTDYFGDLLRRQLAEEGVDGRYLLQSSNPTPLALARARAEGDAEYAFYLEGTSYADISNGDLPSLDPDITAVHVGTLALATDPPSGVLEQLVERATSSRLVMIDPNVRSNVTKGAPRFRERFERWTRMSHVLKLSVADASLLYPGASASAVIDHLIELGPRLVILTHGADGAEAHTSKGAQAALPAPRVSVVDSIGAGDTFGAATLHRLTVTRCLTPETIADLNPADLASLIGFASNAASLQCTRRGADPPTLADLEDGTATHLIGSRR